MTTVCFITADGQMIFSTNTNVPVPRYNSLIGININNSTNHYFAEGFSYLYNDTGCTVYVTIRSVVPTNSTLTTFGVIK